MTKPRLAKRTADQINKAVDHYIEYRPAFETLAQTLLLNITENDDLSRLVHSTKYRTKNPDHLKDKLERKAIEAKNKKKKFDISIDNLFVKIEDLAGIRLLHLHTQQTSEIHSAILDTVKEHQYTIIGTPEANTWDIENKSFFEGIGFKTRLRESMYTSLHYIVRANRRTEMRCELQVRTLMEEVWGEVSHTINYPHQTESIACQEQLKALARLASGCTRLVDSIFSSYKEYHNK